MVLLAGPNGTPYSQGLWRLKLSIPVDYPASPPKAAFLTKIWHPNVEESTGSVCVDTLKKDWEPSLSLRHVLLVISCLLINPNPDSALNSSAGHLLQEDYEGFAQQARLMTSIHARIPLELKDQVMKAKFRGETEHRIDATGTDERPNFNRKGASASMVIMKNSNGLTSPVVDASTRSASTPLENPRGRPNFGEIHQDAEDPESDSKENNPSLPLSVVMPLRRPGFAKRPLADLPAPPEAEVVGGSLSPSEQNIAANCEKVTLPKPSVHPIPQGSQVLMEGSHYLNRSHFDRQEDSPPAKRICSDEVKENIDTNLLLYGNKQKGDMDLLGPTPCQTPNPTSIRVASIAQKAKIPRARVGVRRL